MDDKEKEHALKQLDALIDKVIVNREEDRIKRVPRDEATNILDLKESSEEEKDDSVDARLKKVQSMNAEYSDVSEEGSVELSKKQAEVTNLKEGVKAKIDKFVGSQEELSELSERVEDLRETGAFKTEKKPSSSFTLSSIAEFFKKIINFISCGRLCKDADRSKSE